MLHFVRLSPKRKWPFWTSHPPRKLDPNISNCRWPSISFPAVSSFRDCSHAYRSCDLSKMLWFEKNVKQVLRRPITLLVTSYCLTITYDRVSFTYKSLRNHVQKCCIFLTGGAYAPYTHIVCRRHCDPCEPFRPCSVNSIQHFSCPSEHWQLTATITKTFCTRPSWLSDLGYFLHFFILFPVLPYF